MFTTEILSEHTPLNNVNIVSVSNAILINQKRISVYQVLFLHAGYQTNKKGTYVQTKCPHKLSCVFVVSMSLQYEGGTLRAPKCDSWLDSGP